MRSEPHSRTHLYLSMEHEYSWGPEHMDVPLMTRASGGRDSARMLRMDPKASGDDLQGSSRSDEPF